MNLKAGILATIALIASTSESQASCLLTQEWEKSPIGYTITIPSEAEWRNLSDSFVLLADGNAFVLSGKGLSAIPNAVGRPIVAAQALSSGNLAVLIGAGSADVQIDLLDAERCTIEPIIRLPRHGVDRPDIELGPDGTVAYLDRDIGERHENRLKVLNLAQPDAITAVDWPNSTVSVWIDSEGRTIRRYTTDPLLIEAGFAVAEDSGDHLELSPGCFAGDIQTATADKLAETLRSADYRLGLHAVSYGECEVLGNYILLTVHRSTSGFQGVSRILSKRAEIDGQQVSSFLKNYDEDQLDRGFVHLIAIGDEVYLVNENGEAMAANDLAVPREAQKAYTDETQP